MSVRPFFRKIDHLVADNCTLQICTEPLIVSVPLTADTKRLLIDAFHHEGVSIQPHDNPQILSMRYLTLLTSSVITCLEKCQIHDVFVSGYGLKVKENEFAQIFPENSILEWDNVFKNAFFNNLPASFKASIPPTTILERGNNFFQIGKKVKHSSDGIMLVLPVGPQLPNCHREPYHLLGTLGERTTRDGVTHRFGSATFKSFPTTTANNPHIMQGNMQITKRVFYAVSLSMTC